MKVKLEYVWLGWVMFGFDGYNLVTVPFGGCPVYLWIIFDVHPTLERGALSDLGLGDELRLKHGTDWTWENLWDTVRNRKCRASKVPNNSLLAEVPLKQDFLNFHIVAAKKYSAWRVVKKSRRSTGGFASSLPKCHKCHVLDACTFVLPCKGETSIY